MLRVFPQNFTLWEKRATTAETIFISLSKQKCYLESLFYELRLVLSSNFFSIIGSLFWSLSIFFAFFFLSKLGSRSIVFLCVCWKKRKMVRFWQWCPLAVVSSAPRISPLSPNSIKSLVTTPPYLLAIHIHKTLFLCLYLCSYSIEYYLSGRFVEADNLFMTIIP